MKIGHYNTDKIEHEPGKTENTEHGYRTDTFDQSKRIVCMGDSYTFAFGSPSTHAWPSMLEFPVWNLGSPGASAERIKRIWYSILHNLNFDLAVILWPEPHRREHYTENNSRSITGGDEMLKFSDQTNDGFNLLHTIFDVQYSGEANNKKILHYAVSNLLPKNSIINPRSLTNVWHDAGRHHGPDGKHPDLECYKMFAAMVNEDIKKLDYTYT